MSILPGEVPAVNNLPKLAQIDSDGLGVFKKLHRVMSEIKSIGKDQKNLSQGFKFRGIDQFVNALHPLLIKNKLIMIPQVVNRQESIIESIKADGKVSKQKSVQLIMAYVFIDVEDGSTYTATIPAEGLDAGDKATNKALSAGLKYTLIQTFMVPTEDMAEADLESPVLSGDEVKTIGTARSEPAKSSQPEDIPVSKEGEKAPAQSEQAKRRFTRTPARPIVAAKVEDDDI